MTDNHRPVRILLVEDEPLWQQGICALLDSTQGYSVVGIANDYEQAIRAFTESTPDIVLLDWKILGEKDGLAVGQALLEVGFPENKIILVTGSQPSLIPSNPFGYVPKQLISTKLLETLATVLES